MPRTRPAYPPEYRDQIVALSHGGRTPEELAAEFELSARTIRNWIGQAQTDAGVRPGPRARAGGPARPRSTALAARRGLTEPGGA